MYNTYKYLNVHILVVGIGVPGEVDGRERVLKPKRMVLN